MSAESPEGKELDASGEESKFLGKARQLLHKRLKVVVKDGRVLIGDFLCIDKQGNLILGNTYQQVTSENELSSERLVGQVLVPAMQRTSCHVELEHCFVGKRGTAPCGHKCLTPVRVSPLGLESAMMHR